MRSTSTISSKAASCQTSEYPEPFDNSVGLGLRSKGLKGRALACRITEGEEEELYINAVFYLARVTSRLDPPVHEGYGLWWFLPVHIHLQFCLCQVGSGLPCFAGTISRQRTCAKLWTSTDTAQNMSSATMLSASRPLGRPAWKWLN